MLMVLSVIVLLTFLIVAAMTWSKSDRVRTGKLIHNQTVQELAESTLQYGRGFYGQQTIYNKWSTYLTYFVTAKAFAQVNADHPELVPPLPADTGYDCFTYAKDDPDELPPAANNPQRDNNLQIFVGAMCVEHSPPAGRAALQAELIAPLQFNPAGSTCQAQFGAGTQGNNNCSSTVSFR
jgi:hypothetical protein